MWDASHLAMILCALRHWKRVSMPPISQYLRHPLPRANHIPPRTKTTRLTAKNPAHLLLDELKHVHHILFKIQIITLALVFYRGKIVKNTDLNFREAHIVPQLLTMLLSKRCNGLTFNYHIIFYKKIHMMLVVDALAMKFYREIKFTHSKNILLLKSNFQRILINVFVEKRSHIIVNDLATPCYVITIVL